MSAENTTLLDAAAKRLDGAYLLGVGEAPSTAYGRSYQSIHCNPLLLCRLKEEQEGSSSMVILNNGWQGYAGEGNTSVQTWEGMDKLKELAPCFIQSVRVKSKGKLSGSLVFTLQGDDDDVIKVVVTPYAYAWRGEKYPVEEITFFRAS